MKLGHLIRDLKLLTEKGYTTGSEVTITFPNNDFAYLLIQENEKAVVIEFQPLDKIPRI